jgi:hypothetical protein
MADALHRLFQHGGQFQATLALTLQQMEGHPLRTLAAHARQAAQSINQFRQKA